MPLIYLGGIKLRNIDALNLKKSEIVAKLNQAMKDGDEEAFAQAFTEYTDILQEAVLAEARVLCRQVIIRCWRVAAYVF